MAHMTNSLATPEQLYQRNFLGSLPVDLQDTVFYAAQCLTQAAGLLLELPQSVTAQANVVLARYWLVDSMMLHEFSDVSAACIYLVAKLGPLPRSPRDVTTVYSYLLSPSSPFLLARAPPPQPPPATSSSSASSAEPPPPQQPPANNPADYYQTESDYGSFHRRILLLEARVLYTLSFDTHVSLPHPLAVTYLQALDFLGAGREAVSRRAVEYLNAALLSPQLLYLTHQPNALAVAAVYNAARDVGAKMPDCEWWEVFDVDREELGFLVVGMRSLEGWVRRRLIETPTLLEKGMPTRRAVELEMRRSGLHAGNGSNEDSAADPLATA